MGPYSGPVTLQRATTMTFVKRLAHLSRLAFFVSLGVAATIVDACGGKEDDSRDPEAPKGGGSASTGQAGAASGGSARGGTMATGGSQAAGGITGLVIDAGTPPKDAELWDVICE